MTDRRDAPANDENDENVVEERTASSTGTWNRFAQRADDEERLEKGQENADTAGMSPFPDVDLLADALGSVSRQGDGGHEGDTHDERGGAP